MRMFVCMYLYICPYVWYRMAWYGMVWQCNVMKWV